MFDLINFIDYLKYLLIVNLMQLQTGAAKYWESCR